MTPLLRRSFLTACFLIPSILPAQELLYETGFEESDGFPAGPMDSAATGWQTKGPNPFEIVAREDGGDGQMMASRSDAASHGSRTWLFRPEFGSDKKTIVEVAFQVENSGSSGCQANLQVGDFRSAPGLSRMAAIVSFRGSGKIVAFNGGEENVIGEFQSGNWYNLRIECDPSSQTFDVIIDGDARATGLAFNDPSVHEIVSVGLTHYTGSDATKASGLAVDNVKIQTP